MTTSGSLAIAATLGVVIGATAGRFWSGAREDVRAAAPSGAHAEPAELDRLQTRVAELERELALERAHEERSALGTPGAAGANGQVGADLVRAARSDALAWLQSRSADRFGDWTIEDLATARRLDLSGLPLDADDLAHLASLPSLRDLDLRATAITDVELRALASLENLERLDLAQTLISEEGLDALRDLSALEELSLIGTDIGDLGLAKLLHLESLREIALDGTRVTDEGLASLAGLPITSLAIGKTAIGDEGLRAIESFELRKLSLYRNENLTDAGFAHLASQGSLEVLNLRGVAVSEAGLAHLGGLHSVREINASMTMDDAGMEHLAGLGTLERLGLYSNPGISDAGVQHLRDLHSLHTLQLQFTSVGDGALEVLDGLSELRFLDLRGTEVSADALAAFRARHPRCRVLR